MVLADPGGLEVGVDVALSRVVGGDPRSRHTCLDPYNNTAEHYGRPVKLGI